MKKYGPNDGMVLLSDMILPGGITLTKIGSDHFLMDQHLDVTSVALTTAVDPLAGKSLRRNVPCPVTWRTCRRRKR